MAVSLAALRRYVVAHQGYATRFRRAGEDEIDGEIRRLQAVQLDSIATVARAHRLTLSSRMGAYDEAVVSKLLASGRVFEYWAHEACLVSIDDYVLFKRRMAELRDVHWWGHERTDPETEKLVVDRIREEGPLPSRAFEGRNDPGSMWGWKPAKRALEHLFAAGELTVSGRQGFQRLYDLPERVIPRAYLDAPTPSEDEFRRGYALRAVQGRGALTEAGIAEHCRFKGGVGGVRPHVDRLVVGADARGQRQAVRAADRGDRVELHRLEAPDLRHDVVLARAAEPRRVALVRDDVAAQGRDAHGHATSRAPSQPARLSTGPAMSTGSPSQWTALILRTPSFRSSSGSIRPTSWSPWRIGRTK